MITIKNKTIDHLMNRIDQKSDSGELFIYNNDRQKISFESGKIKKYDTKSNSGYAVRVTKENKTGFSYGNNFENIDEVIDNALSTIKFTNEKSFSFANESELPELPKEIYNKDIENFSTDSMIETNKILYLMDYLQYLVKYLLQ